MKTLKKKTLPDVPDNKGFGRHFVNEQESKLPPAVLDQIKWVKRETKTNKKEKQ